MHTSCEENHRHIFICCEVFAEGLSRDSCKFGGANGLDWPPREALEGAAGGVLWGSGPLFGLGAAQGGLGQGGSTRSGDSGLEVCACRGSAGGLSKTWPHSPAAPPALLILFQLNWRPGWGIGAPSGARLGISVPKMESKWLGQV